MFSKTAMLLMSLLPLVAAAQDPVETDGDKYKVIFENDRVRVLDYSDSPGDKTNQHHHPAFVLYAVSAFERAIHLPDGKVINRSFEPGGVLYSDAQTHVGENTGKTPTHAIIVEMKASESPPNP